MYSAHGMGVILSTRRRGVGDVQALTFPFLAADCVVGATDPATGDTIAGCPTAAATAGLPPVNQSMTVTAKAYPTWMYWAAGGLAGLLVLKAVRGR